MMLSRNERNKGINCDFIVLSSVFANLDIKFPKLLLFSDDEVLLFLYSSDLCISPNPSRFKYSSSRSDPNNGIQITFSTCFGTFTLEFAPGLDNTLIIVNL